jgi:hypothetical protein
MKAIVALLLAAMPAASSAPGQSEQSRMMDEVERKLRLPEHSRPFRDYVRYYAAGDAGVVVGRYVIPRDFSPPPGDACEELDEKGGSREVKCEPIAPWPEGGVAGKRYWVASVGALPIIFDGGCSVVNIRWNAGADEVEAWCNGNA